MMDYSYLGKGDLNYLTLKLVKAAREHDRERKREELKNQISALQSRLGILEKSHPVEAITPLREKITRLDETIRRL